MTFDKRILETATTFANETDGTWLMTDWDGDGTPDLVFIKTRNTPNGHVEVHVASGQSGFQKRILETATTFANETDGTWLMTDWDGDGTPDLVFIKTATRPMGTLRSTWHQASRASRSASWKRPPPSPTRRTERG
jgi:FG-GAP-like repeat